MRPRKATFPKAGYYGIETGSRGDFTIVKSLRDEAINDVIDVLIIYSSSYTVSPQTRRWWIGETKPITEKEIAAKGIKLNKH